MSTKIYTGFRFVEPTLLKLYGWINEFRTELRPVVETAHKRWVTTLAVRKLDMDTLDNAALSKPKYLQDAYDEFTRRVKEIRRTKVRDSDVDYELELSILPMSARKVLGIVFCEQQDMVNLWMGKQFVEDYAYWDNTDKPDEVTEAQWEKRGKDWNDALPGVGVPSMCGFTADCVDKNYHLKVYDMDVVLDAVPPLMQRSRWAAAPLAFQIMCRQQGRELEKTSDFIEGWQHYSRVWSKSPEGQAIIEKHTNDAMEKLVDPVLKQHLTT